MKIAFLFAPYSHKKFEENIYVVDEDFGLFPPISLAYAAAIAEKNHHEVALFDINVLLRTKTSTRQQILDDIERFNPDLLAVYFTTYMFQDTLEWIRIVRQRVDRPVVAGGINCLLYPQESLSHPEVDYCTIGHAHESLPALLDALGDFRRLAEIPGIGYKQDGAIRINPPQSETAVDFDSFPLPARHLLPNSLYHSFISQRKNFTIALTSLGCPFNCSFCSIADLPRGNRSPDNIMAEIDEVVERYNVREIDYFDANFTTDRTRIAELLEKIIARGHDLEFSCRTRIDCLDDELLGLLSRAGFRQIYLGIESSEQQILDLLSKNIRPSAARDAVRRVKQSGIRPLGFFMLGSPGETFQTAFRTILFALSLGLDYAQFSRTIAKPGSGLYRDMIAASHPDYWREWVLGRVEDRRLPSPWTEMTEHQIEFITKTAYLLFYYRPQTILKHLTRIKSFEELRRSFLTATRMLIHWRRYD